MLIFYRKTWKNCRALDPWCQYNVYHPR